MSTLQRIGIPLALCAALVLTLPACGSTEELWTPEVLVDEQPLSETRFEESVSAGRLTIVASRKVRARETPLERLSLLHSQSYADFNWDDFGLVFWSILGGIVSVGLYFLFAFVVFNPDDDEN